MAKRYPVLHCTAAGTDGLMRYFDEAKAQEFPSLRGLTREQIEAMSLKYERMKRGSGD